jgi:hypothetical protein
MSERIRWHDETDGMAAYTGYVGTLDSLMFHIWRPDGHHDEWVLTTRLSGDGDKAVYADGPDKLKAEAERWLERFISSLGAVFPDEPDESAAFQLSEARDVLARWDAEQDGEPVISREKVLADQVRALLAIIEPVPAPPGRGELTWKQ